MANLKARINILETIATHSKPKPGLFFRYDGTDEQAAEIKALNDQGIKTITFRRAEE